MRPAGILEADLNREQNFVAHKPPFVTLCRDELGFLLSWQQLLPGAALCREKLHGSVDLPGKSGIGDGHDVEAGFLEVKLDTDHIPRPEGMADAGDQSAFAAEIAGGDVLKERATIRVNAPYSDHYLAADTTFHPVIHELQYPFTSV